MLYAAHLENVGEVGAQGKGQPEDKLLLAEIGQLQSLVPRSFPEQDLASDVQGVLGHPDAVLDETVVGQVHVQQGPVGRDVGGEQQRPGIVHEQFPTRQVTGAAVVEAELAPADAGGVPMLIEHGEGVSILDGGFHEGRGDLDVGLSAKFDHFVHDVDLPSSEGG